MSNPFTAVKSKFFAPDDQKATNGSHHPHNDDYQATSHNRVTFRAPQSNSNSNYNAHHHTHHNTHTHTRNHPHYPRHIDASNTHYKSYSTKSHAPTTKQPNYSRSYQNRKRKKAQYKLKPSKIKHTAADKQIRSQQNQRADVIADYLEKVPLLARLSREDRYNLGHAFKQQIYGKNDIVIRQNEAGHEFFIITKGDASVLIHSATTNQTDVVATLHPGDYFGETALLTAKPRNATVQSNDNALYCLVLDKATFISVFGRERVKVNFGKRGAVSAESFMPSMTHKRPSRPMTTTTKSESTKDLIASAIENNVLFAALDEDQIARIVEEMWSLDVKKGDNIINQSEEGDNFYVVEKGTFHIYVTRDGKRKQVATRATGESFGELALMYNTTRSATVQAITDCKVWAVQRYMFRKILIRVSEQKLKEYEAFLKHVPLLDSLLVNERRAVAEALNEVTYSEGDMIVEQGSIGDTFYIIKKGEAVVYKSVPLTAPATEVARLKTGSFFGERALVKNERRAATVQVISSKMTCLTLDREAFCLLLGPLAELMHRKIDEDYDGIARRVLNRETYNTPHNHLGIAHAQPHHNTPHKAALQAKEEKQVQDDKIRFEDLSVVGILGRGSFGSVDLVVHKQANGIQKTYALKTVSKAQIVRTGQQVHIVSEKNVMMALDSQFIVKLYETYKSDKYLYFLLEVVLGGELFTVLRARTVFDESTARFYTASVTFAFDYMHSKSIIYRDLKPENLLLDSRGFLKITDFGFAKVISDRTYTLCGTPDYLAPEVISGAGHGFGVDWWTVGVLLFEMLASYPPFYHEDPMKTYARIMYGRVNYPKHFTKNSADIIRSFLNAKPTKRIGIIKGGIENIKKHKWFTSAQFDWDSLFQMTMKPPIVPVIKSERDRSNFEASNANPNGDEEEQKLRKQEKYDAEQYVDDGSGWDDKF